jgi:raffinose/stachyose/melibiose transport system substrate-binding protein
MFRRTYWRNLLRPIALSATALGGLLAVGGGMTSAATTTTLTVQILAGGFQKAIQAAATSFEAMHPGVTVDLTVISDQAKVGPNLTVLTGSNPPDIGFVPITTTVYSRMFQAKQLVSLRSVWNQSDLWKRYGSQTTHTLASTGTPYVVDISPVYYNIVYYNVNAFKKAGITPPANHQIGTMNNLYGIVAKLKSAGYEGMSIGPTGNYEASWLVDGLLPTIATPSQSSNYNTNFLTNVPVTAKYTDRPFVQTLTAIDDMGTHGVFQDGYQGQSVAQGEALFLEGKTGMVIDGSWSGPAFKSEGLSFPLGWMLLPSLTPGHSTVMSSFFGNTMVIPTGAAHPELAKQFLSYILTDQVQLKDVGEIGESLPAVNSVNAAQIPGLNPIVEQIVKYVNANGSQPGWSSVTPANVSFGFGDQLIQSMWTGSITPAALAAKFQANLQAVRAAAG